MTLPLAGIRILDLSRLLPGPYASLILADLGATVDKVEDLAQGDYLRHVPPLVDGDSAIFHALNRNKRSVRLDLKKPEGVRVLRKLLDRADVLIEQFRPGVLARLGLGVDSLVRDYPRLIVCSITGYGQTGPSADKAGHDLNYLAHAGVLGLQGPPGGAPQVPAMQVADIGGALFSAMGILAAVIERTRTGKGKHLDISLAEAAMAFVPTALAATFAGSQVPRGGDLLTGGVAVYGTYATSDGEWVTLGALEPKFWSAFCAGVGREANMDALRPGPHQEALRRELTALFASRTRAEWEAFAGAHDACVEVVRRPEELPQDPHALARRMFFELARGQASLTHMRTPLTAVDRTHTPPPRAGEHTEEVLLEAGFSAEEVLSLQTASIAGR